MDEAAASRRVRTRYGVPADIHVRVAGRAVLAWLDGAEPAVCEVARTPEALPRAAVWGRAPLGRVLSPLGPLLVRTYRKGGLLRGVRGPWFHGRWRPLVELVLHRRLEGAGVPVAQAVGCVVRRGPVGWRGWLLVREEAGALDLEAWLYGKRRGLAGSPAGVLAQAGRAVRQLHDAGVRHADLHPKNLLVRPGGDVLVLDLDRASVRPGPLGEAECLENLVRLGRAIEKHRLKGLRSGRREALRFLAGYAAGRAPGQRWLERVRERLGRGLRWRVLWWRLTGAAKPWRPAPGVAPEEAGR